MSKPSLDSPTASSSPRSTELTELLDDWTRRDSSTPQPTPVESTLARLAVIAVVEDTHHPQLPGRVFARWRGDEGQEHARWVACARSLRPRVAERVLLTRPSNDIEWFAFAVIGPAERQVELDPAPSHPDADALAFDGELLRLEPNRSLRVLAADGRPMFEFAVDERGPVVRALARDLDFDVPGCLRLGADRIELRAERGGVDIRTDADTVVRARTIRLN